MVFVGVWMTLEYQDDVMDIHVPFFSQEVKIQPVRSQQILPNKT